MRAVVAPELKRRWSRGLGLTPQLFPCYYGWK